MFNCVHFFHFFCFLCIFFSIIWKAYLIQNVLIVVINDWEFNCIECIESVELEINKKKIKG